MADLWWLCGLMSGVITAVYVYCNQLLKMPTAMFMIYRGVGLALVMLPFTYFFPFNPGWPFWTLCVVSGMMIAYSDTHFLNAISSFDSEISFSIQPLSIGLTFFLWLAVKPSLFVGYWHSPVNSFFLLLCLLGIISAILMIRQAPINWSKLKFLLPCLLIITLTDGIQKVLMGLGSDNIGAASFYYLMITSLVAGLGNMAVFVQKERNLRLLLVPKNIFFGMSIVSLVAIAVVSKSYGMVSTPNPAYVSALIFLYPVWIMMANNLYLRYKKYIGYEHLNKNILFLLLVSIIGLIIFGRS